MQPSSKRPAQQYNSGVSRRQFITHMGLAATALATPSLLRARSQDNVIIIGAGLSGLQAALILEHSGLKVTVLEGSNRIGGRLYTLDDVPGKPEGGGNTIGSIYGRTIATANRLGIELLESTPTPGSEPIRELLDIQQQRVLPTDWLQSELNPFKGNEKVRSPAAMLWSQIGANPLRRFGEWREPWMQHWDIAVDDFLRHKGITDDALALMGANNSYGTTLANTSLLNLYRIMSTSALTADAPRKSYSVAGGNQRLPEAMAASLHSEVILNRQVRAIAQSSDKITVTCENGETFEAKHVIAAVPFSALRHVAISPSLPELQQRSISNLAYAEVYQIHMVVEKPFWQGSGYLPNAWSDGPLGRIFASDPANTGAITNMVSWVTGAAALALDKLTQDEVSELTLREIARIMPESKGAIRIAKQVSWQKSQLAGGSWAAWAPGQISAFARSMAQPAGNLHFAGEHTAVSMPGMEGALESGERAAMEILTK